MLTAERLRRRSLATFATSIRRLHAHGLKLSAQRHLWIAAKRIEQAKAIEIEELLLQAEADRPARKRQRTRRSLEKDQASASAGTG